MSSFGAYMTTNLLLPGYTKIPGTCMVNLYHGPANLSDNWAKQLCGPGIGSLERLG